MTLVAVALRVILCAVLALPMLACTTEDTVETIDVSAKPMPLPVPSTSQEQLAALDAAVAKKHDFSHEVNDVREILRAKIADDAGQKDESIKHWKNAASAAEGRFGKMAFQGWIASYAKSIGKKSDVVLLAKLVLSETRNGAAFPYMVSNDLNKENAVAAVLEKMIPEHVEPRPVAKVAPIGPPSKSGIPTGDPLLIATLKTWCAASSRDEEAWKQWVQSIGKAQSGYWAALSSDCTFTSSAYLEKLRSAHSELKLNKSTAAMALECMARIIKARRAAGERETVADDYLQITLDWKAPGVTSESMGLEPQVFVERQIDETLWASRYRALIGDLDGSKKIAQEALTLVSNAFASLRSVTPKFRESLAVFRAEAYHILAFRVAVERKDFDAANALNSMALQTPHLNQEWKDRLNWFAGLYEYLGGNLDGARRKWEAMMVDSPDESLRPPLYFWLARTYHQLGQKAESEFYIRTLVEDHPLSYYAVVAVEAAGIKSEHHWSKRFIDAAALETKLAANSDYGLTNARRHKKVGRLLIRAEILSSIPLGEYARLAVNELDDAMQKTYLMNGNSKMFVYLSRLHFAAGNYFQSIVLTTQLSSTVNQFWDEWPEQFLLYFPQPYSDVYGQVMLDTGVERQRLMAISRQESSFRPEVKSPANAVGIMQLMRRTASRYLQELQMDSSVLDERLLTPQFNIAIGGRYLRDLNRAFSGSKAAVYGSYNAGEYAVESWMARRTSQDPLLFVELIPYGETKGYIRNVWRNEVVYEYLSAKAVRQEAIAPKDITSPLAKGRKRTINETGFALNPDRGHDK